jgi:hypothetical protein
MKLLLACLLCCLGASAVAQQPAPGSPGTPTPQPYANPTPQPRPADPGKPALFKRPQPAGNTTPPPNPAPRVEQPRAPVDRSGDR